MTQHDGPESLVGVLAPAGRDAAAEPWRRERAAADRRPAESPGRRERRFIELLVESVSDGIAAIDQDFRHTLWNAGAEAMTGLPRGRVLGRHLAEVFPDLAGTPVEAAWCAALAGRRATLEGRHYFVEETGRAGIFDASFAPLRGAGGGVIGAIAFLRDITERHRLEETLRQSQKLEAIGQLTGGVAHDFNNLLSAVLGNLELIGTRSKSAQVQAWVRNASRAAERGARLTQELLSFSRKQRRTAKPVDMNALIAGMGDLLGRSIGVMVRIERRLTPGLWPVLIDPTQLELIVLNLAINARDAMPEGGVLAIETANLPATAALWPVDLPPGDYVALAVRDTGVGMSEEVRARAGEPFFTTKAAGKGTGLGLSMVCGAIKQAGGTVAIDSAPGEGTAVRIYLPRLAAEHSADSEDAEPAAAPAAVATVLVVDDDEDIRTVATTYLQSRGYRIVEAESGRRALDILDSGCNVDVMVADYAMPTMNGADLAVSARERRPDLSILFTTGYADAAALAAAASQHLVLRKPFRLSDLAAKIEAALQRGKRLQPAE